MLEISVEEAVGRNDLVYIDVRTPREYEESSVVGAVNIPLLDEEEYSRIGITYKLRGEAEARLIGLELLSPRLPSLVNRIIECSGERIPLLYCQRGGLRSLTLARVLELTGIKSLRLKGGFKAYRQHVREQLESFQLSSKVFVLHGLTGTGKTAILNKLAENGAATLDLEGLARHRGSVFGNIGLQKPRSQKDFETMLLQELSNHKDSPFLILEGEGRRIGNIHLPKFLADTMDGGTHLLLTASLEQRVNQIVEEYIPEEITPAMEAELEKALLSLRQRLGKAKTGSILSNLKAKEYKAVAASLCTEYYDRFYDDSRPGGNVFAATIAVSTIEKTAAEILNVIDTSVKMPREEMKGATKE